MRRRVCKLAVCKLAVCKLASSSCPLAALVAAWLGATELCGMQRGVRRRIVLGTRPLRRWQAPYDVLQSLLCGDVQARVGAAPGDACPLRGQLLDETVVACQEATVSVEYHGDLQRVHHVTHRAQAGSETCHLGAVLQHATCASLRAVEDRAPCGAQLLAAGSYARQRCPRNDVVRGGTAIDNERLHGVPEGVCTRAVD